MQWHNTKKLETQKQHMITQQPLLPLKYHGKRLLRDGGKWEESVVESFDTGTHKILMKCLAYG